jgi:DNA-binding XRE family transcriptional regulator
MGVHATKLAAETMGQRLKRLRTAQRLTWKELAAKVGSSHVSIWNWETGRKKPSRESLARLAEAFHVSVDYLEFGLEVDRCPLCAQPNVPRTLYHAIADAKLSIAKQLGVDPSEVTISVSGKALMEDPAQAA